MVGRRGAVRDAERERALQGEKRGAAARGDFEGEVQGDRGGELGRDGFGAEDFRSGAREANRD